LKSRGGFGAVLVIILVLLCCIAVMVMGRSFFSSFVADQTTKGVFGDEALLTAQNALTEAHFRLGALANTPGMDLFGLFRSETGAFSAEIPLAKLPALQEDLKRHRGLSLPSAAVMVDVLAQAPLSQTLPQPHDRCGVVRLTAEIYHDRAGVMRRVTETYDYKLTLVTPPRYFDTYTLFVSDAVFLVNACAIDGDVNKNLSGAVARMTELGDRNDELAGNCDKAIQEAERARDAALVNKSAYDDAIANMRQARQILEQTRADWPRVVVVPFGTDTTGQGDTLHYFPDPPLCLYSYAPEISLSDVNLPVKVTGRMRTIDEAEREVKRTGDACHDFLERKPSDLSPLPGLTRDYCTAALAAANEYRSLLIDDYKAFQDAFVEVGGDAYDAFLPFFAQFLKTDLLTKASAVLTEGDPAGTGDGRDINRKFQDLFDEHDDFSGVLYVANPTTELIVDREFKGRVVIVVDGDVTLRRVAVADPAQDLVTVVAMHMLRVQGPVQASLIPFLGFSSVADVPITGNLIFGRLNFLGGPPDEVLAGHLVRDERLLAGPPDGPAAPDSMYFTVGPEPTFVDIERR